MVTADDLKPLIAEYKWLLVVVLLGIIILGAGAFWYRAGQNIPSTVEVLSAADVQSTSKIVIIDISGAVNRPGVYELNANSRIGEVIGKAGGLSSQADVTWVERNLNQAQVVKDGMKLYIPRQNETVQGASTSMENSGEKININSASQSELEALPGIGPVTAQKIIANRPYQEAGDLISKKVVGQKVFDQIQDLVSTW